MRILVADDDPVSLLLLESSLTEWGHEVVTASDGIAAWELLRSTGAPPLAILDWIMPGLDGIEICRMLREERELADTYVIMLTGRTDTRDIVQCMEAGADDYVSKPFEEQQLRARLRAGRRIVELQQTLAARAGLSPAPHLAQWPIG